MARRRMFSLDITDTDKFLDMPISAQGLYFHLGQRADDDGFVANPKRIVRLVGANDDDLNILIAKEFVYRFNTGIMVITDWKVNNQIKNDRYHPTIYNDEKAMLEVGKNKKYALKNGVEVINGIVTETPWIQNGSKKIP